MVKADIEAVKAANPIFDVLRGLGIPAQNGRIRCFRPENHAHGDRTPSVSVWPDRDQFKCWVCADVKGDVIDLVRLARGCSFREALEFLSRNTGFGPSPGHRAPSRPTSKGMQPHPAEAGLLDPAASRPDSAAGPKTRAHEAPDRGSESAEEELEKDLLRLRILGSLLEACPPVGGRAAQYLQKRRIFRRTWESQKLKMIEDYGSVSRKLEAAFGIPDLIRTGFFNAAGHLRYYRHKLLFPYYDAQGRAVYMQARAIDPAAGGSRGDGPKELSMSGHIPIPYNVRPLNGEPGQIYLCEGVIDTLTLIEQGFPAVGVPGAANFKPAWASLFRNKSVHVAFDPDAPGESGAAKTIEKLRALGIEAHRLAPPPGKDLNEWFRKG